MPLPPPRSPAIQFDASRYSFRGDHDGTKVWYFPEGGGVGLYSFQLKPDLPHEAASVADLRTFYERQLQGGMQVVECQVVQLDGVQCARLIAKVKDGATGPMVYLGSLTIPFRAFSYVVKMQCAEDGPTGMREAVLTDWGLKQGTVRFEDGRIVTEGWTFDDKVFDTRFPAHPLSRVRAELKHIAETLTIRPDIKASAPFIIVREKV